MRGAWRYRWLALGLAASLPLSAGRWYSCSQIDTRRRASIRRYAHGTEAGLAGLTVEQDVDAQLNFVRQSLLAGPQLEKIAAKSGC